MQFSIPKFHEAFLPILKVLENGEEIHYEELKRRVRDTHYGDLPADLLNQKTSTGDILILNRIGWAKSYLKQGKFIEQPRRAIVRITPKGLATLKAGHLTLAELRKDADYKAAQKIKEITPGDVPLELAEKGYTHLKT